MLDQIIDFAKTTGAYLLFGNLGDNWKSLVMIVISLFLLWLGIKKQFEPLYLSELHSVCYLQILRHSPRMMLCIILTFGVSLWREKSATEQ